MCIRDSKSTGLGPGVVRLNDSNFLMLIQALQLIDPAGAKQLRADLKSLHQGASEGRGDPKVVAKKIRANIAKLLPKMEAWKVDAKALRALSKNLFKDALSGEYADYAGSEQAAMALQTVVYGYYAEALIDDDLYDSLERVELTKLLASVQDPDVFNPDKAKKAFKALQAKLKGK